MSIFFERYEQKKREMSSLLCVGLDPDPLRLPVGYDVGDPIRAVKDFLKEIIQATRDFAVAYKPNCAFFEALGPAGIQILAEVIGLIRQEAPGALVIADAKRSDIEHSATAYAKAFFQELDCDALTLNPYMGMDCIEPFLSYSDRAAMVLCHTSNPGAAHFQKHGDPELYLIVARTVAHRNQSAGNLWLVVGATRDPQSLSRIRQAAPGVPFLIPGVGAQGARPAECLRAVGTNVLINAGRNILYAARERSHLEQAVRKECQALLAEMRLFL